MFKKCTKCNHEWETEEDFISDNSLLLIGYMANLTKRLDGVFLFNHEYPNCETTLGIKITDFKSALPKHLANSPIERPPNCPGHCLSKENMCKCNETHCLGNIIRDALHFLQSKMRYRGNPKQDC